MSAARELPAHWNMDMLRELHGHYDMDNLHELLDELIYNYAEHLLKDAAAFGANPEGAEHLYMLHTLRKLLTAEQ